MNLSVYAVINRDALSHNLARVRILAPNAKVVAVVKANAYGHGLETVAHTLQDTDAFAVARVDEGIRLRQAGFMHRVIVLGGFADQDELEALSRYNLDSVVHNVEQLRLLQTKREGEQIGVWLKLDTGMNRLGIKPGDFLAVFQALATCAVVKQPIRVMTHFANADVPSDGMTDRQIQQFFDTLHHIDVEVSLVNSAGIMAWPQAIGDWVRPGIMLYGISPFAGQTGSALGLKPVMTLYSRLIAVKPVQKGESVGYGCSWVCLQDTRIGIVACGYGDGYPRHAKSGTPVLVNGQRASLVGHVSMDMLIVDLAAQEAKVGDPVVLWGDGLPIEEIAEYANTIPYTLVCSISQRVKFIG